jgi:hypothetical protein
VNVDQVTYLFLSGAEMDPTAVRTAYPGARFVARARVDANGLPVAPAFSSYLGAEVWGILVTVPGVSGAGDETREAMTDDGRTFAATIAPAELAGGEPVAALAAARYWELPPAYVTRLRAAVEALGVPAADEEPSDRN